MLIKLPLKSIDKIELITINSTIKSWYKNLKGTKPDYVINGTLFTYGDYSPIGTVIIDGKLVKDSGTGYGIGTNENGEIKTGTPWNKWHWYYTGYPPIIHDGKPFNIKNWDSSIQGITKRSAVGVDGDNLYLISEKCSLLSLQSKYSYLKGLYNNDGGGSSMILENGKPINDPTENRKIANCLAIWLNHKVGDNIKAISKYKQSVYNEKGTLELRRYIGKGDTVTIYNTVTNNLLIKVEYPLTIGGTRTAYVKSLEGFKI